MRFPFSMATLVASVVILGVSATLSASAARGQEIAVVDIQHIFKNHYYYKSQMKLLAEQAQRTDLELKTLREKAEKIGFRLKSREFVIGSREYRDLQQEYGQAQTDFAVKTTESRKWFLEEKSKIYYKVYSEIARSVEDFAKRNNIVLVLQYVRNDNVARDNPASVDRMIKNPIVFQHDIDITERILKTLPGFKPNVGGRDFIRR